MKYTTPIKTDASKFRTRVRSECGFTLLEMLISLCILTPIMWAVMQLFSVGVQQQCSEQSSVEANQDASAGFNMMTTEIAQAGSNTRYFKTTTTAAIAGDPYNEWSYAVGSTSGLRSGDAVELYDDSVGSTEVVKLTGVSDGVITGIFQKSFSAGSLVRLFSLPYTEGFLYPGTPTPNSTTSVAELKFFGDIYGDGNMYYAEYAYDSGNDRITRSVTSLSDTTKKPQVSLITNVKSAQFLLHTDALGIVTSVTLSMTVESEWKTHSKLQEIHLFAKVAIPSMETASALKLENMQYGPVNPLPSTPARVSTFNQDSTI